ncbi:hypothetical protein [Rhodophyticola sp.]|uniref:hypothetical protein n=1 Tax=Rhodophyticola sp. TaxID=2680032 RepID=UPI003D2BBE50
MSYTLRDFGSYTVGGRMHRVMEGEPQEVQFTRTASYTYDPRGHFAVEQTYVQYFIPDRARDLPPVVLVHGGGMHGSTWETTPDGRPGWINLLLDRGREVHVVDMVERGRSGFAPGLWDDAPILRSAEEAWTLFRIGPSDGFVRRRAFEGTQFPVSALDGFLQRIVPRWLSTTQLQTNGVIALIDRLGAASLVCHSQGGEVGFDAFRARPDKVFGILAVEPSAFPPSDVTCPITLLAGDYLDTAQHWFDRAEGWRDSVAKLRARGVSACFIDTAKTVARGGSHFLMMDRNSDDVLDAGMAAL